MRTYKVSELAIKTINEMANGDLEKMLEIFMSENELLAFDKNQLTRHGMKVLGSGSNGMVYDFVGSDGYEYAVKVEQHYNKKSDGYILEKLQGIEGYPKLFSYIEGKYEIFDGEDSISIGRSTFYIMMYQKIKGFEIGSATGWNYDKAMVSIFAHKSKEDIVSIFEKTITETLDRDIVPCDIHSHNVMFDIEDGIAYIVDVGNFQLGKEDAKAYVRDASFYIGNCCLDRLIKHSEEVTMTKAKVVI